MFELGRATIDDIEEAGLQLLGDRAAAAAADDAIVEFANRGDFRGGAGEEGFVGNVDVVAGETARLHFETELACHLDDGVARDAGQRRGDLGFVDLAVLDDEGFSPAPSATKPWVSSRSASS